MNFSLVRHAGHNKIRTWIKVLQFLTRSVLKSRLWKYLDITAQKLNKTKENNTNEQFLKIALAIRSSWGL